MSKEELNKIDRYNELIDLIWNLKDEMFLLDEIKENINGNRIPLAFKIIDDMMDDKNTIHYKLKKEHDDISKKYMTKCIVCNQKHFRESMYDYFDGFWCMQCDDKYCIVNGKIERVQDDRPVPKYKVRNWERHHIKNEHAKLKNVELFAGHRN